MPRYKTERAPGSGSRRRRRRTRTGRTRAAAAAGEQRSRTHAHKNTRTVGYCTHTDATTGGRRCRPLPRADRCTRSGQKRRTARQRRLTGSARVF